MARMVLARIRRMGKQWASCGIPVSPPDHMKGQPAMKRLCPKLVPGQVIEVPSTHNLLTQACVEQVRGLDRDEFMRPWVFPNSEAALLANPTKSRLGADQIASGLALAEGAQAKGRKELAARQAAADEEGRQGALASRGERPASRGVEPADEDEDDGYVPTSQNRLSREEADELRGRDEEPEEVDEAPLPRRGRAPRGKR